MCAPQEINRSLAILPADSAEDAGDWPFAAAVKSETNSGIG
jgi:hypothetical protein